MCERHRQCLLFWPLRATRLFSFNKFPLFAALFAFLRFAASFLGKAALTFPRSHDVTSPLIYMYNVLPKNISYRYHSILSSQPPVYLTHLWLTIQPATYTQPLRIIPQSKPYQARIVVCNSRCHTRRINEGLINERNYVRIIAGSSP